MKRKSSGTRSSLRFEPPTLEEAIFAAQGLANDIDGQTQIAAMLMGLPEAEVRTAILKAQTPMARSSARTVAPARSSAGRPVVVVERRSPRVRLR